MDTLQHHSSLYVVFRRIFAACGSGGICIETSVLSELTNWILQLEKGALSSFFNFSFAKLSYLTYNYYIN